MTAAEKLQCSEVIRQLIKKVDKNLDEKNKRYEEQRLKKNTHLKKPEDAK